MVLSPMLLSNGSQREFGMLQYHTVYVKCQFSKGGFPTERLFRIDPQNGRKIISELVPSHDCFDLRMRSLSDKPEPPQGKMLQGFLEALLIRENADGTVQLDLPNGIAIDVPPALLKEETSGVPVER